jgi:hypothetical protein
MSDEAGLAIGAQLVTGMAVAWVTRQGRNMCGLSSIHRVYGGGKTYCMREIPDADRLFPPLKSLHVCSRCATLCARAEKHLEREQQRESA